MRVLNRQIAFTRFPNQESNLFIISVMQFPTKISVINHLLCHATIDANIFSGDKSGFVRTKK